MHKLFLTFRIIYKSAISLFIFRDSLKVMNIIEMSEVQSWHKDIFSCFDAMPICLLSYCFPIIGPAITQYLAHKEIPNVNAGMSACLAISCCCIGNLINRKRMRNGLKLKGIFIGECIFYICCCYSCMVIQEYQEVNWQVLNKIISKPLY